jgi:hypothetical protein
MSSRKSAAEASRIALEYKRLILLGKLELPLEEARSLVGPDCAYHLYFTRHGVGPARGPAARRRAARRRSTRRGGSAR